MNLVIIFGPQAVGKMTVGQQLAQITDLKLFHNHMTIDVVAPLFGYGPNSPVGMRLVNLFRQKIFEEFASSKQFGLIFTYVWAFDEKEDWDYINGVCQTFESQGGDVYFVELETNVETRIKRNRHENRLRHKPSKRDIAVSQADLLDSTNKYRLNSKPGEITKKNYVRIDNTTTSAKEVAKRIKKEFNFQ